MWGKVGFGIGGRGVRGAAGVFALAPAMVERAQNGVEPLAKPPSAAAQALHDGLVIGDWHSDALLWDRDLTWRADRGPSLIHIGRRRRINRWRFQLARQL